MPRRCLPLEVNGARGFVCMDVRVRKCRVRKKREGTRECDGPKPSRKSGTCDTLLCEGCRVLRPRRPGEAGEPLDLCPRCAASGLQQPLLAGGELARPRATRALEEGKGTASKPAPPPAPAPGAPPAGGERVRVEPCLVCGSMKPLGARHHAALPRGLGAPVCKHNRPEHSDCVGNPCPPPCCWEGTP
jgi:hypothetical protein